MSVTAVKLGLISSLKNYKQNMLVHWNFCFCFCFFFIFLSLILRDREKKGGGEIYFFFPSSENKSSLSPLLPSPSKTCLGDSSRVKHTQLEEE